MMLMSEQVGKLTRRVKTTKNANSRSKVYNCNEKFTTWASQCIDRDDGETIQTNKTLSILKNREFFK